MIGKKHRFMIFMVIFSCGIATETKKRHLERTPSRGGSDINQKHGVRKNLRKVQNLQVLNQEASKFDKDEGLLYLPLSLYQHHKKNRLKKNHIIFRLSTRVRYRPAPKMDMNLARLLWFRENMIHPVTGETWDNFILHSCKKMGVESWSPKLVY